MNDDFPIALRVTVWYKPGHQLRFVWNFFRFYGSFSQRNAAVTVELIGNNRICILRKLTAYIYLLIYRNIYLHIYYFIANDASNVMLKIIKNSLMYNYDLNNTTSQTPWPSTIPHLLLQFHHGIIIPIPKTGKPVDLGTSYNHIFLFCPAVNALVRLLSGASKR